MEQFNRRDDNTFSVGVVYSISSSDRWSDLLQSRIFVFMQRVNFQYNNGAINADWSW